jgi:hypothetical protein
MITACANQVTNTSTSVPSLGAYFPQLAAPQELYMEALIKGELVLENGCLQLRRGDGSSILLIWDSRFSTQTTEQGVVQVIDSGTGEVLASEGDLLAIGGGSIGNPMTSRGLKEPIPTECLGSYYLVGGSIEKIDRPPLGAHFPQLVTPQSAPEITVITGEMVLDNGCLRISGVAGAENEDGFLLIWNLEYSTLTELGTVQVMNSATGKVLVSAGDLVRVSGGFIDDPSKGLIESLPPECAGPYFLVGRGKAINKIGAPASGAYFPQLINTPSAYPDLPLMEGKLTLENGCLRVSEVKGMLLGNSFLVIWDSRFSTRTEQGLVQVINSSTGEILASVGDYVSIGGGVPAEMDLMESIPEECPGPYYLVGHSIKKIGRP